MKERVTTYHVEIDDPAAFRPAGPGRIAYEVRRSRVPLPELNRFLYASVGAEWRWYMRLGWSYRQWERYLDRPEVGTWLAYVDGTPAGYFELEWQPPRSVEIVYFGLMPQFVGAGMGGAFLGDAVRTAWDFGREFLASDAGASADAAPGADVRVWLHTCSLDHPQALANYQARGFSLFDVVETVEEVPDGPMDPWPGAGRVTG
ncbi:MAG: GNAT family N-acetyltransferase [Pseudomonadales bacterium]